MRKTLNRFVLYAVLAIFALLAVLLGVINGVNFTIEAEDADQITELIAEQNGFLTMNPIIGQEQGGIVPQQGIVPQIDGTVPPFDGTVPQFDGTVPPFDGTLQQPDGTVPQFDGTLQQPGGTVPQMGEDGQPDGFFPQGGGFFDPFGMDGFGAGPFGAMDPFSPELTETMRFFTVRINKEEGSRLVAYQISAVTEDEAIQWAESLKNETTGWTKLSYRYRVYERDGATYVTVIDQSRELLPSYRILIISLIGLIVSVAVSFVILKLVAGKLFQPIEEADRKQKRFIADAESEFKVPLTVISANTEVLERESGPNDATRAIHRQVKKMTDLVRKLGRLAVFEVDKETAVSLTDVVNETLEEMRPQFGEKGLTLESSVAQGVMIRGNREALVSMVRELAENALRYSKSNVTFKLSTEQARILLIASNNTDLPDGSCDQVFDRFTTLENGIGNAGLGLAHVKEIVKQHDGRAHANVENGVFTLRIDL